MLYHSTNRARTISHRIAGGQHRITRRLGVMILVMIFTVGLLAAGTGFLARIILL